jgi:phospholipase/carboxylesterase
VPGSHLDVRPVLAGAPPEAARVGAVVVHGRGQDPAYMLEHLVARLAVPEVAYVLPAAAGGSWYPDRFWAPREANEPWLGQALDACEAAVHRIAAAGVPAPRIVLAGFSQGACLVADLLARRPGGFGGAAVLTGALIGPEGDVAPVPPLDGLPVFMASSRFDAWVPLARVEATADACRAAGADVELVVTEDREHVISREAVDGVRRLLRGCGR